MTRWLDRRVAWPGPYLTLCLSDAEYRKVMKSFHIEDPGPWVSSPSASATTHHCTTPKGDAACIVCMGDMSGHTGIEIAGLLVHEAVHVWQNYADGINEHRPGREQEAYAVQGIAQELMTEYARRMNPQPKEKR